jgi:hypothetical protein
MTTRIRIGRREATRIGAYTPTTQIVTPAVRVNAVEAVAPTASPAQAAAAASDGPALPPKRAWSRCPTCVRIVMR